MTDLFEHVQPTDAGDSSGWRYIRVAVERGLDQGGSGAGLTYKSREPIELGRRVEVPLGRGNASSAGIVIATGGDELLDGFPASRIKPILRDTGAGLPPDLIELARWIASYYVCPLGMVLSTMLPAAVKHRTGLRSVTHLDRVTPEQELAALAPPAKLTPSARLAWETISALPSGSFPLTPDRLALRIDSRTLAPINKLVRLGLLKEVEIEDVRQSGGVPTQMGIEQADPSGAAFAPAGLRPTLTPDQSRVVEGIGSRTDRFGVHLLRGVTGSGKTEVYLRVLERVLATDRNAIVLVPEISLTPQTAGRFIERFRTVGVAVLHSGLSASQRHKEWTRAALGHARVVVGARSAVFAPIERLGLIVVDEEHASDYKQDQLPRYHGRDVAIKRAHMQSCPIILGTATPSLESWVNAQSPASPASAGGHPRSIMAPAPQPPPLPQRLGKYTLWELPSRIGAAQLPKVEIVDLAEERKLRRHLTGRNDTHLHLLGPTLERAIGETLHAGGQVLLLLNRRGYATYIACPDSNCGWVMTCNDCDAKMIQHRVIAGQHPARGVVRCHHCLAQKLLPEKCPICEKRSIALGLGTQRIEEEIARKFADQLGSQAPSLGEGDRITAPGLLRIDGDTMNSAKDYFAALTRFASGEVKVLLGTQMIAKGLDFPNVRLVGVINADTALSLPDFRAAERTFQLVSQVAGRAGRGTLPGRVIVQTIDPHAAPIVHAAAHDFVSFAREELATRRQAGLPPMSRMARIVFRDEDLGKVQKHANEVAVAIRDAADSIRATGTGRAIGSTDRATGSPRSSAATFADAQSSADTPTAPHGLPGEAPGEPVARALPPLHITGPMPCPVARIAGFHRYEIQLTSAARMLIQDTLAAVRAKGLLVSDARTAIDIDPIALM